MRMRKEIRRGGLKQFGGEKKEEEAEERDEQECGEVVQRNGRIC